MCHRSNRVLFFKQIEGATHTEPLRPGVATPTKALTCHTHGKNQTSPFVSAPYLQFPEHPIHEGWVCWLAQCEYTHQNRAFPPSRQPTKYQQITLLCTIHLLFFAAHVCQIQTCMHQPTENKCNLIVPLTGNPMTLGYGTAPISKYPCLQLQPSPSLLINFHPMLRNF